jgi:hypothetical protein
VTLASQLFTVAHGVHVRRFDRELVLLDLERGEYFSVDEVGTEVWELLSRGEALGTVVHRVGELFDATSPVENDVHEFVAELVRRRLLVPIDTPNGGQVTDVPSRSAT